MYLVNTSVTEMIKNFPLSEKWAALSGPKMSEQRICSGYGASINPVTAPYLWAEDLKRPHVRQADVNFNALRFAFGIK